jgi:hypothetical protein
VSIVFNAILISMLVWAVVVLVVDKRNGKDDNAL